MSNNLDLPALLASQANKTVTVVQMFEAVDAALTETFDVDATLDVTVTLAQLRRNAFFNVTATGAAKKITLQVTPRITVWNFPAFLANDTTLKVGTTEIAVTIGSSYLVYQDGTTNGLIVISLGGGTGGGGVEEAPNDGNVYGRLSEAWTQVLPSAITVKDVIASYTLTLAEAYALVRLTVASANNLTVPANSAVAFVIGTSIIVRQTGAGQTTFVADTGVTINTAETLRLRKLHSMATLTKVATNVWDLSGDLELAP